MIVPVLTRYDLLDRMIKSINYPIKDLVIVDNGAKQQDWSPTWNQWVNKIWHLKFPSNLGVPGSWNLGIKSLPFTDYWLITNFDVEWGGDSLKMFQEISRKDKLVLSNGAPPWCAFSLGWEVVEKVGLFDESFVPAYFEDNDYQRRCEFHNVEVINSFIPLAHDNSSTLKQGFQKKNDYSYAANSIYMNDKIRTQDFTEGKWSVRRRRKYGWD
jgi:GT2 family glycosyltransferase